MPLLAETPREKGRATILRANGFVLRPWQKGDEDALARHANDRRVWRNLTDRFPHPYRHLDAVHWIELNARQPDPPHTFAIALPDGEAIGGVGLEPKIDLHRRSAEIGYWLGVAHWGKGVATEAVRLLTGYAFERFDYLRLEAEVIAWNPASARVLEKAGYRFEARHHNAIFKDGEVADALVYARLRDA